MHARRSLIPASSLSGRFRWAAVGLLLQLVLVPTLSCGRSPIDTALPRAGSNTASYDEQQQCLRATPPAMPGLYRIEDPRSWPSEVSEEPALAWLWLERAVDGCAPAQRLDLGSPSQSLHGSTASFVDATQLPRGTKTLARSLDALRPGAQARIDRGAQSLVLPGDVYTTLQLPRRLVRVSSVRDTDALVELALGVSVGADEVLWWLGNEAQVPTRCLVYAPRRAHEALATALDAAARGCSLQTVEIELVDAPTTTPCLAAGPLQRAAEAQGSALLLWADESVTQLGLALGTEQPSLYGVSEHLGCVELGEAEQLESELRLALLGATGRWQELHFELEREPKASSASRALWRHRSSLALGLYGTEPMAWLQELEPALAASLAWEAADADATRHFVARLEQAPSSLKLLAAVAELALSADQEARQQLEALASASGEREDVRASAGLLELVLDAEDWSGLEAELELRLSKPHASWQSAVLAAQLWAHRQQHTQRGTGQARLALVWARRLAEQARDLPRSAQLALALSELALGEADYVGALSAALAGALDFELMGDAARAGEAHLWIASLLLDARDELADTVADAQRSRLLAETLKSARLNFSAANRPKEVALVWVQVSRALLEDYGDTAGAAEAVAQAAVYAEWSADRDFVARVHSELARAMARSGAPSTLWLEQLERARRMAQSNQNQSLVDALDALQQLMLDVRN